jgi:hypothetical protein
VKITNEGLRRVGRWVLAALVVLALIALVVLVMSWVPPHAGS